MPTYRLSINNLLRAYADLDQAAEEIAYFAQAHRQPEPAFDLDTAQQPVVSRACGAVSRAG